MSDSSEPLRPSAEAPAKRPVDPSVSTGTLPAGVDSAQPMPSAPPALVLTVSSRDVLAELDRSGFDIGRVAFSREAASDVHFTPNNAELSARPGFGSIARTLLADLKEFRARDRRLGVGMRHAHRAFDPKWLSSPQFHFQLAGVVNRIDRRAFDRSTCGQLRFLYRLTYTTQAAGQTLTSRVPMTINVVRNLPLDPDGGCRTQARRWQRAQPPPSDELAWLLAPEGPLHDVPVRTRLRSVEVNLQSARWPSTVRPNMAGHAEYLMRVFEPSTSGEFTQAPLENTPDVPRLTRDPDSRSRLIAWLTQPETLRAVDQGTALMPAEFSARRAVSVAPHGLARLGNRPFAQLGLQREVDAAQLVGHATFETPDMLVRRLDGLSCSGCHQTRSVAGFHFLGEDDPRRRADVIAVPHSPHFQDELQRRRDYLSELAAGSRPSELRLPAERMGAGEYGAHCGLDRNGDYAAWYCDPGLQCVQIDDPSVGTCLPERPGPGDACELGRVAPHTNPHRDAISLQSPLSCGAGHCERSAVGFPGGMCSQSCANLPDSASCGGIALLTEFNGCLARNVPFETCIADNTRPGALRSCSLTQACREDYICARLPDGSGGCIPPYFLFQMRVDGHVIE